MFKWKKSYAYFTPNGEKAYGIVVAFIEVTEGPAPKRFAIFRRFTEVGRDRVIGAPIYSCPRVVNDMQTTFSSQDLDIISVYDLIHGCEHVIPFTGKDPKDYKKNHGLFAAKDGINRREMYWRSPWYRHGY